MLPLFTGLFYHAVGASCASLCYVPQRATARWSWQTFWLAQAVVCWLLLPVLVAWLTIPHLLMVWGQAPASAMLSSFGLGMAYGVGGTAFGLAIRYVGYSLTYAIAVGMSCILGTLLPSLLRGQLAQVFDKPGADWLTMGLLVGVAGIALCGLAGWLKDQDGQVKSILSSSSLGIGLLLCVLAGILSALYGVALDQGQPIADVAARYGAGQFQGNSVYPFANGGAFVSTLGYCLFLHNRERTFNEYGRPGQGRYFGLATLTGLLWYAQFFFYGLGHTRMGEYRFTSWAIHMIMLVLFSTLAGLILREWAAARPRSRWVLSAALLTLVGAVLLLTYGNYQADH